MLLSAILLIAAIFFSVLNRGFLQDLLASIKKTEQKIVVANKELEERETERKGLEKDEAETKDVRNVAQAALDESEQNLAIEVSKVNKKIRSIEEIDQKQAELDVLVKIIFPDGDIRTPDELRDELTGEKSTLTSRQERDAELDKSIAKLEGEQAVQSGRVDNEEDAQFERKRKILLGGLKATIVGANEKWGFLIVNAGKDLGVEPNSKLIVERGGKHIATLRITTLRDKVSVCEVVKGSKLFADTQVRVGDKVIFQDPFQG